MSHDSGFRRMDHDSTHQPTARRQKGSKASRAYEERLSRRHAARKQARTETEDQSTEDPSA